MEQKEFKTVTVDGDLYFNANEVHAHISKVEEDARKDERERVEKIIEKIKNGMAAIVDGDNEIYQAQHTAYSIALSDISVALKGLDNNK